MADKYLPNPNVVFDEKPSVQSGMLIFGETDTFVIQDNIVTIEGVYDDFQFYGTLVPLHEIGLASAFPNVHVTGIVAYDSDCARPVTCRSQSTFQKAENVSSIMATNTFGFHSDRTTFANHNQPAVRNIESIVVLLPKSMLSRRTTGVDRSKKPLSRSTYNVQRWYTMQSIKHHQVSEWQEAVRQHQLLHTTYKDRTRFGVFEQAVWSNACLLLIRYAGSSASGHPFGAVHKDCFQTAQVPPIGIAVDEPIKPPTPYVATTALLFSDSNTSSTALIFGAMWVSPGSTIVIPVRRTYIVLNNVEIRRIDGNYLLPVTSMNMHVDMDSWTWDFSASMPSSALSYLQRSGNDPVMLEAKFNGKSYLLIAEKVQRNRQFGKATITVTGRGQSALLSDPYSPIVSLNNTLDRTAQQLMNDALSQNGVALGWSIDWRIDDWMVPAGTWHFQGNYMSALKTIANAAGAFIQPDPSTKTLRVRPRYPFKPWDTSLVSADFELPSSAVTTESVSWEDKPAYNAVYVSGTTDSGILGYVKRAAFAGNMLPQMIADPLITDTAVARARGIAVLADTGYIANYSLHLPVFNETGIIEPGAIVKYVDNDQILGVVKGVSVSADTPKLRQTIEVQAYG